MRIPALAVSILATLGTVSAQSLTFEDRVAAQRAIEQVYWDHRIWPAENPGPKPALAAVLSDAAIEARVVDYLAKSSALEERWKRPITAEQLQAELDRMAGSTRDPRRLGELFDALGNDPRRIAETLARQTLADRLIREWHAVDARWPNETFDEWWNVERGKLVLAPPVAGTFHLPPIAGPGCADNTWSPPMPMEVPDPRSGHTAVWTGSEMIVWGGLLYFQTPVTNTGGRYNPATDTWTQIAIGATTPAARAGHGAVWTGTEMIVWGGGGQSATLNTGGRYDPAADTWSPTSTGAGTPAARSGHTAVWTGTQMIVWGGQDSTNTPLNTGGRYTPSSDTWAATSTGAGTPTVRYDHSAVWTGTVMVVWGGHDLANVLNTGGRYNPTTNTWQATSVGANVPVARRKHAAVWSGTQMIVWGGLAFAGSQNTGGRYNPTTNTWTTTAVTAGVPAASITQVAVWTGSRMLVWNSTTSPGGSYDPAANTWSAMAIGPNGPQALGPAVWTGTEMIIWGGGIAPVYNTGARYSPASNSWVRTSVGTTVPLARSEHVAAWTGAEMVVWGGGAGNESLNSGGRYFPATNTWVPTSSGANVPAGRRGAMAVWTGTRVVVWGGGLLDSGGRYDPVLDSWAATSVGAGVPSARADYCAIWSGTKMIVWGGQTAGGVVNSGGRYDPASDTWLPTSIGANVPEARATHACVWTGSKMFVWGGYGTTGARLNSGGRYDPVSDTWLATSTGANVPEARHTPLAVWTGTEVIVFGGNGGTPFPVNLSTGGRYDPSGDTWTSMATSPPAAVAGAAVWTGSEMITWGGINDTPYNGGGRFHPSSNAWSLTSTGTNVPQARALHTAVWSGTEMIVWGGNPDTSSGGRYCACASPLEHHRDLDGDGFGAGVATTFACTGSAPAGWVANDTDCDDANPAIHPGAAENCNGLDDDCDTGIDDGGDALCADGNDCTGDACNGVSGCSHIAGTPPPEIAGQSAAADKQTIFWAVNVAASGYQVVRGVIASLPVGPGDGDETCFDGLVTASLADPAPPPAEGGFWYLVRGTNACGGGTYGTDRAGAPRVTTTCP